MSQVRRDGQVCLRIAGELRIELEREAADRGRSLSNLVRHVLIQHVAQRVAAGATAQQREA
jgi:predicted HicB family RNase H-like nuclease